MSEFLEEPRNNGKELLARAFDDETRSRKAWGNYARVLRVIPNNGIFII